jgi:hypothetical protein
VEVLVALFFAFLLILGLLAAVGARPWSSVWPILLAICAVFLAAALWLTPWGRSAGGLYWLPVLFAVMVLGLIRSIMVRRSRRYRTPLTATTEERDSTVTVAGLGLLLWLLCVGLAIAAMVQYGRYI